MVLSWHQHVLVGTMCERVHLLANLAGARFADTVNFEMTVRTALARTISQEHFIVLGPVFVILFKQNLRLDRRVTPRKVFPPGFSLLTLHILRQFLAMNSNSLVAKLFCVFFDHFFASLSDNVGLCPSGFVFVLHAQVTHLTRVQPLLSILETSNVLFERF